MSGTFARVSPYAPAVMIALGGMSLATFLTAHFFYHARLAADVFELLATFFVLAGGVLYLQPLPGHPRPMTVFGLGTAVLLLARALDCIEELSLIDQNGKLIDFLVRALGDVESIVIVAAFLLLIRTVRILPVTVDASRSRFREAYESKSLHNSDRAERRKQ